MAIGDDHIEPSLPDLEHPTDRSPVRGGQTPLLVCFSHLRWDFVWQRPQHLLTRAARWFDVVFVEEPVFEAGIAPRLSLSFRPNGVQVALPCLPEGLNEADAITAQQGLIAAFLDGRRKRPTVFWYYTPMALAFSAGLARDVTVYDNMDELSAFRGASADLLAREEALLRQADVVFAGGMSLYEAKRGRHANLHAFPSSIDTSHFAKARLVRASRPARIGPGCNPRLGFFGVLDERLDADLVDAVAALRPEWQIDMVGPVAKIDPASLPQRPNITWPGPCAYADLPELLSSWDVGLMPFALNEATRFISPTKTPEFLAAGLPVVSTPITDVVRSYGNAGLVEIAATPIAFVEAVERVLARPRQGWLEAVDRRLAGGSWDTTWESMRALITQALPAGVAKENTVAPPPWMHALSPAIDVAAAEPV
jgi:glycosyltransferase involved in cell wall biosynthesis